MSVLASLPAGTYSIDASHSRVGFSARHAMVTKVRGSFNDYTGSAVVADGGAGIIVDGELTIKDVTKPLTIEFEYTGTAKDPFGNDRYGFEGSSEINRKDFGLTWNAALETGGLLVSENIKLEFEISTIATK